MKILLTLGLVLLCSVNSFSQREERPRMTALFADTGATSSDYVSYIENAIQKLSVIRTSSKVGYKVLNLRNDLPETDTTIRIMKESIKYGQHLDLRDLQMFELLTKDLQKKLGSYRQLLDSTSERIRDAANEMKAMRKDSTWQELRKDTIAKRIFAAQLKELRKRWKITDSTIRTNTIMVDAMTIHVANNSIINAELLDQMNGQMLKLSRRVFTKEQPYLWQKDKTDDNEKEVQVDAEKYYRGEREAILYYFRESSGIRTIMLILGILFYIWANRNYRHLEEKDPKALAEIDRKYLTRRPFVPALVIVLILSPFFDLTPPAVYITFMQFLLMLVLTYLFYTTRSRTMFVKWITLVVFFLLLFSVHLISTSSIWLRLFFLALTIASMAFGVHFWLEQRKKKEFAKYVQWVTIVYVVFNFVAALCNVFGRWTLAQLFGSSAVFGLTQIIALSAFIQILLEAFTMNILYARVKNGLTQPFDYRPFIVDVRKTFIWIALLLWLMVLSSNLNIYNFLYERILSILTTPRNIGSITFNLGSLILFFLIIWISSLLQKYIGFLFGDTAEDINKVNKRQHSKLLLARLVLLTAGFLLAVAASGLPMDKITIVLGALGVGIGLGLQNIVNNFVSGVILIFERPFQVGDTIEIADKKGTVREIGIRHSILLTPDGGEVIVPNGDMLANRITNWTLSNDYIRIEIPLKIEVKENWGTVSETIQEIVEKDERVLPTREPIVLLNNLSANQVDFKVLVWCKNLREADVLKSDLIEKLYTQFKERSIDTK